MHCARGREAQGGRGPGRGLELREVFLKDSECKTQIYGKGVTIIIVSCLSKIGPMGWFIFMPMSVPLI